MDEALRHSQWSQDAYIRAMRFAIEAHGKQIMRGMEIPCLTQLTLVSMEILAALIAHSNRDGNLAVQCALLHDVIEYTETTDVQIRITFGENVVRGVLALTQDSNLPDDPPTHLRTLDVLRRIRKQPSEIWMVKMADTIINLDLPPRHWNREKMSRYWEESMAIHEALGSASSFLARRLMSKIEVYGRWLEA